MKELNKEDFIKNLKTPKIGSIMKGGKKKPIVLNEKFFENIFDLEMSLRQQFSMPTLEELVHQLTVAIEYYESIDDQKFRDYQMRLCVLLAKPEIIKQMQLEKEKNKNDDTSLETTNIKYKKDQEKKQLKMKVNYISQLNSMANQELQVKTILDEIQKNHAPKGDELFNNDITKQTTNFHQRLQEKRNKKLPKIEEEDITRNDSFYDVYFFLLSAKHQPSKILDPDSSIQNLSRENHEKIFKNTLNNIIIDENEINFNIVNNNVNNNSNANNIENEKSLLNDTFIKKDAPDSAIKIINEEEKTSFMNIENCSYIPQNSQDRINNVDEKYSPFMSNNIVDINNQIENTIHTEKIKPISMFSISEKYLENFHESKVLGPKHKQMFNDIKETIEYFISDFNQYFYEHLFQRFIEQIQKITDEKYLKYIEISKNYHSQIKEMEFLINSANEEDNSHKDSLQVILDALREEQQHELDRIEDYYNKLINDAYSNFKNFGFKNNSGIQIIEEKFKLDTFNMMNDILNPKNK